MYVIVTGEWAVSENGKCRKGQTIRRPIYYANRCINRLLCSLILHDRREDFCVFACADEIRNSHIPGGVYIAGVDDWRRCIDSCRLPCTAVDFDQNDLSCWHHHGLGACSRSTVYQPGVNHYRTIACLTQHRSPLLSGIYATRTNTMTFKYPIDDSRRKDNLSAEPACSILTLTVGLTIASRG